MTLWNVYFIPYFDTASLSILRKCAKFNMIGCGCAFRFLYICYTLQFINMEIWDFNFLQTAGFHGLITFEVGGYCLIFRIFTSVQLSSYFMLSFPTNFGVKNGLYLRVLSGFHFHIIIKHTHVTHLIQM